MNGDIRVYNRALTSREVLDLYIATSRDYFPWWRRAISWMYWLVQYENTVRRIKQVDLTALVARGKYS